MKIKLEIPTESLDGALIAHQHGADRLELCSALELGGLTPSSGLMGEIKKHISIPVFALIRPRSGDFLYSETEFNTILADVFEAKKQGFEGIVVGFLNADGAIDEERTKTVCKLAFPMEVTFHRAFDMCNNPQLALEQIIEAGCTRILTSGQKQNALEGASLIQNLVAKANGRITIMAGSGVRTHNVKEIIEKTGVMEVHTSAKTDKGSNMNYRIEGVNMGSQFCNEFAVASVDASMVGEIREIIDGIG